MATTRKRTPTKTRSASRKPSSKRKPARALAPEATALFEEAEPVCETDVVLDVVIPRPPIVEAVVEHDIVDDKSAPQLMTTSDPAALVHVPPPPPSPTRRPGPLFWAAVAAASLGLFTLALRHRPSQVAVAPTSIMTAPEPLASPAPSQAQIRAQAHAAFAAGQELEALRVYDRLLRADRAAADAQLIANLLSCYGKKRSQPFAATLIVRYQLTDARPGLNEVMRAGRTRLTRAGARYTLEKLRNDAAMNS